MPYYGVSGEKKREIGNKKQPKTCFWVSVVGENKFCKGLGILVLKPERLVCAIRYLGFLFQTTPAGIVAEPQEVAVFIGHLPWDADLVAVEVVDFLFAFAFSVCPVADLCQRFVGILIGVDISIPAIRVGFLQEVAAVPNEAGFLFEAT